MYHPSNISYVTVSRGRKTRMYEYIISELIDLVTANFNVAEGKQSIMGHSMDGYGALTLALNNHELFKSVSGLASICNPIVCPLGTKAFTGYLGPKETGNWEEWDAKELIKKYNEPPFKFLLDQGTANEFLSRLNPQNLVEACKSASVPVTLNQREGYNHGYFYIASFISELIEYHTKHLQ